MEITQLKQIIEAVLMASGKAMDINQLQGVFHEDAMPDKKLIREALESLEDDCKERAYELQQVASGWRFQVRQSLSPWVSRLWEEKPQKYSRAMLETLALIAYRQPITRGDIEDIRGVAVSSHIMKTLQEREWVKIIGHRDVPGRPAMYATTRRFLDYFSMQSLEDLPTLAEIRDLDNLNQELNLGEQSDSVSETPSETSAADATGSNSSPDLFDEHAETAANPPLTEETEL